MVRGICILAPINVMLLPGGDVECRTGNEIMGQMGCSGQCGLFGLLFHFLCDILHPHLVYDITRLGNRGDRVSVFGSISCIFLAVCEQIWKNFWGTYDLRSS